MPNTNLLYKGKLLNIAFTRNQNIEIRNIAKLTRVWSWIAVLLWLFVCVCPEKYKEDDRGLENITEN